MINVVIPMAGQGSRFTKAGYSTPKPFITARGKPLIEWVIDNIDLPNARFILLARPEHMQAQPEVVDRLQGRGDVQFVTVSALTEGAACTVLLAKDFIDSDQPLLIANSDQYVEASIAGYVQEALSQGLDGSILTFLNAERDPKWSFARVDDQGIVREVKEKVAISDLATVGLYFFSQGKYFVEAAAAMMAADDRVNGEFYVCPAYNYAIQQGLRFGVHTIPVEAMHGLGTPDDLNRFIALAA